MPHPRLLYSHPQRSPGVAGDALGLSIGNFHNYGVLWTPDALTFFIDGRQTWTVSDAVPQCPEFILLTTEIRGAAGGMHTSTEIKDAALPHAFVVDHVRVFDPA